MSDITMCNGELVDGTNCKRRANCHRFTATPDNWQSWFSDGQPMECDNFMDNSNCETELFLIWSHEHNGWWKKNEFGYTQSLNEAERFPRYYAEGIVVSANLTKCNECMVSEGLALSGEFLGRKYGEDKEEIEEEAL